MFLGGIARVSKNTARTADQLRGEGSWNKWRGPALRGEVAVYAAKATRRSIDQRARCVRVTTTEILPLSLPDLPSALRSLNRVVRFKLWNREASLPLNNRSEEIKNSEKSRFGEAEHVSPANYYVIKNPHINKLKTRLHPPRN